MPVLSNHKHELFAQGLAEGKTADEAYIAAGFKENRGNASRLKANESIVKRVDEILSASAERVEITKARVLEELGKIGFSDIRKIFTPGGNLLPPQDMDDDAAACVSAIEVVTRKVPGGDSDEVEHVAKIKLWDKRAALVDIGKHLGMFTENHRLVDKDNNDVPVTETEAARRIAFVLANAARKAE
ncbi:hypothetical protein BSL82_09580 [Tardibacter chloracetimidivorans]|uniref:Terminase small subunit n=1 Tax=Tardibacter chloracetimidivorans TaxID=1921510 RepID=A0A1L3ZV64_9SPHN|nr:terminase small subunit [Tardibacter chloracetimidivorans]API59531.1 hypothetical protein BSL82_09580 [Tardibacter chloracetimidivorans]